MADSTRRPSSRTPARGPLVLALVAVIGVVLMLVAGRGERASEVRPTSSAGPSAPAPDDAIPRIDVHVHFVPEVGEAAAQLVAAQHVVVSLNASGGMPGRGLEESIELAARTHGAVRPYCNVRLGRALDPDFGEYVRVLLEQCAAEHAVGVKIPKGLGLGLTDDDGNLVGVDDPRLDPLFERAADHGLPVLIHSGDPVAFFTPNTPDNERWDELSAHPEWSFHGERAPGVRWPPWEDVYAQFERRVARHPRTTFVGAHFGNAPEYPDRVGQMFERYPNFYVDTAARVPELGRRPAAQMRAFFERWQDRILYGSDFGFGPEGVMLGSTGAVPDEVRDAPRFFARQWAWFETDGRALPSPTPIQGRWTIDGIHLPRAVLEKVYWRNAARVYGLTLPARR